MRIHNVNLIEISAEEFMKMKSSDRILLYQESIGLYMITYCDKDCPAKLKIPETLGKYRYFLMPFGELSKA